jgi:hypothetical protein
MCVEINTWIPRLCTYVCGNKYMHILSRKDINKCTCACSQGCLYMFVYISVSSAKHQAVA